MNIQDAADIIGIQRQREDSELNRECQRAAEQWTDEVTPRLIHTHRMAFFDGVQYGLKMARRIAQGDER